MIDEPVDRKETLLSSKKRSIGLISLGFRIHVPQESLKGGLRQYNDQFQKRHQN